MKARLLTTILVAFAWNCAAHAGGAVVAGGKTNTAILIYQDKLDEITQQIVLNELGKQLAMGKISEYGWVTDENGVVAKCAQFGLLQTYRESVTLLTSVADWANVPDAIRSVGGCEF